MPELLDYLPIPTVQPMAFKEIIERADVKQENVMEILDIVGLLLEYNVIEEMQQL